MRGGARYMGFAAGLLITLIFAAVMLFALTAGANSYQSIAAVMDEQFKERTCLGYISASVRHFDTAGSISIVDFHGVNALVMQETAAGQVNNTMIYFYDGYVYELYAPANTSFELGDGFKLIQVDSLKFERMTPSLYRVECRCGDRIDDLLFYLSSRI